MLEVERRAAQNEADLLVTRYEEALAGKHGPYEIGLMLRTHCCMQELQGDTSLASFRDHVERRMFMLAWARQGNLLSASRLPNQPADAPKPSKLYCEGHNPRRSNEARRAYQRDRRFFAEYEELISAIWSVHAHELPTWDIATHGEVRMKAYHLLQSMKSTYTQIEKKLAAGNMNQSEIANHLGVTRQAVSVAIRRRKETGQ